MSPQLWWYMSRASGLVAWAALTASLVLGVLLATRALKPLDRPAWLLAMHRWLSGITVVATALHLSTLVADNYLYFGPRQILVPYGSAWKSGAVTWGVVGLYLLMAVQLTSLLIKKLPKRLWRVVHAGSYALVWVVTVHAASAGSDATNIVYQAVALLLTIVATGAAVLRLTVGRRAGGARPLRAAPDEVSREMPVGHAP